MDASTAFLVWLAITVVLTTAICLTAALVHRSTDRTINNLEAGLEMWKDTANKRDDIITTLHHDIDKQNAYITDLRENITAQQATLRIKQEAVEDRDTTIAKQLNRINQLTQQGQDQANALTQVIEEKNRLAEDLKAAHAQLSEASDKVFTTEQGWKHANEECMRLEKAVKLADTENGQLSDALKEQSGIVETRGDKIRKLESLWSDRGSQIKSLQEQLTCHQTQIADQQKAIGTARKRIQVVQKSSNIRKQRIGKLLRQESEIVKQLTESNAVVDRQAKRIDNLTVLLNDAHAKLADATSYTVRHSPDYVQRLQRIIRKSHKISGRRLKAIKALEDRLVYVRGQMCDLVTGPAFRGDNCLDYVTQPHEREGDASLIDSIRRQNETHD